MNLQREMSFKMKLQYFRRIQIPVKTKIPNLNRILLKKHVLEDIVESDESSSRGSVGGIILSVQPLISTTETKEENDGD